MTISRYRYNFTVYTFCHEDDDGRSTSKYNQKRTIRVACMCVYVVKQLQKSNTNLFLASFLHHHHTPQTLNPKKLKSDSLNSFESTKNDPSRTLLQLGQDFFR